MSAGARTGTFASTSADQKTSSLNSSNSSSAFDDRSSGHYDRNSQIVPNSSQGKSFDRNLNWELNPDEVQVGKTIGHGVAGVVYLGSYRYQPVAIKMMISITDPQAVKEFKEEVLLMQRIRPHSNLVQLLGVVTSSTMQNGLCCVTEFCSGGSLLEHVKTKFIDEKRLYSFLLDTCKGMAHLHAERVIHRDLAARNLLIGDGGRIKISDFGFSRVSRGTEPTTTRTVVGPLKWMAPECLKERVYSPATDIWSFGITMIELFTGDEPYKGLTKIVVAQWVGQEGYTHPLPPFIPRGMQLICNSCWNKDPNARPSFVQLHNEIEVLARNPTSDAKFPQKFAIVEEKESSSKQPATKSNSSNSLAPLPPQTGGPPTPSSTPPQSPNLSSSQQRSSTQLQIPQQQHQPQMSPQQRSSTQLQFSQQQQQQPQQRGKGMSVVNEQYHKAPLNAKPNPDGTYPPNLWLYLDINNRGDAEATLNQGGNNCFLIRKSTKNPNNLVLSVLINRGFVHIEILVESGNVGALKYVLLVENDRRVFDNLDSLVRYFGTLYKGILPLGVVLGQQQ